MAIKQINVTQLKCACLDARWRRKWIQGENPSTKFFAPPGTTPAYGTLFHKLAEEYTGWLVSEKTAATLADADALWHEMYERFAEKELSELLEFGKIEAAYHLGQCLKAFCRRISELRSRTTGFETWEDVWLGREFPVQDVRFDVGDDHLFISGQVDALRMHPPKPKNRQGVEVVDYKLSRGENMKHDLLQIAIYAKLLSMSKPGLRFHGILEYYEPELHEVAVSHKELEDIFQELVRPILPELTRQPEARNPAFPKSRVSIQHPAPSTQHPANHLSEKIRTCYASFNLKVHVIAKLDAPQVVRYKVRPAAGVKVVSLGNRAEDLQVALNLPKPPLIEPAQGCVTIDIPKEKPDTVFWRDVVKEADYAENKSFVSFPVGVGMDNEVMVADFSNPNMCHALVAGTSGSGKSEFLKSLLASLLAKNRPDTLRLSIIDPKILTFGSLSDCPCLAEPVITDVFSATPCLRAAVEEMEERYRQLGREGFEDLSRRLEAGRNDIPFYVIIFDEFADLILAGKEEKKEFEMLVARLAAKGRAAGIHLVLTTQRPDSKIVTGVIKANLPLKICLRVTNHRNSQIILDQSGGESLLGRGDLLCDRGRGVERGQSPYISQEELAALARKA